MNVERVGVQSERCGGEQEKRKASCKHVKFVAHKNSSPKDTVGVFFFLRLSLDRVETFNDFTDSNGA
jgi:hypothetical protein